MTLPSLRPMTMKRRRRRGGGESGSGGRGRWRRWRWKSCSFPDLDAREFKPVRSKEARLATMGVPSGSSFLRVRLERPPFVVMVLPHESRPRDQLGYLDRFLLVHARYPFGSNSMMKQGPETVSPLHSGRGRPQRRPMTLRSVHLGEYPNDPRNVWYLAKWCGWRHMGSCR